MQINHGLETTKMLAYAVSHAYGHRSHKNVFFKQENDS
jgi:hypothetical protein